LEDLGAAVEGGGFAGPYLYVVPALELVAVTTGDAAAWIPTSASPRTLVEDVVATLMDA
jgi:hypothetical protein